MPIITFWSNNEKAIGQTVSAAVSATMMAVDHNYKVLLISADYNDSSIENCFGAQESNKEIVKTLIHKPQVNLESGINGLLKLAESNRVTPDVIHDYTKIIFTNRLEVLYSPMDLEKEEKREAFMEQMKAIILNASRYYDYVFVDLKKGLTYPSQSEILAMSDAIVVNVEQGTGTISKLLTMEEIQKLMPKMIWNLCRYDKRSKYNTKNLIRTILKKQAVYETPYNTLLLDATQEGEVASLLLKFKTLKEEDDNKLFLTKIEELNEGIILKYQETRTKM